MHELERATLGQDPPGAQGVGRLGGLPVVELRDRGGVPDERVPEDGGRPGEPPGGRGKAGEPRPDRRDHALGRGAEHLVGAVGAGLAQRPASSRRKNGFPPVSAWQVRQRGVKASGTALRTRLAEAVSVSALGRSGAGAPPSASSSATAAPPGSPSGRAATTSITGVLPSRPARYARNRSDAPSAHCASSTSNASGWLSARLTVRR